MPRKRGESRIATAHQRLRLLQSEVAASSSPDGLADLMGQVEAALQELEVVHEELRQQNEELLATREALEVQRHRYRDLFDNAPYGYLVTDAHAVIEEANQTAADLLGVEPWVLAGKPFLLFFERSDRPALRDLLQSLLNAGEPAEDREAQLQARRGGPVPVVLTVVRDLGDDGKARRLRWMVRDVSHSKATEQALRDSEERLRHAQRLEAVGRLAGGIAHSFNNLLAAISFHSELLREQLGEGDARQSHVTAIQGAGERAAVLARQLLAFGRKQVLQPQVLAPNQVIADLEPILRRLLGEDIELATELSPAAGRIEADPGQIEQVILNLALNARDAMPFGGRLTLGTAEVELAGDGPGLELPPGPYLSLWVADTGTGMSEEVRGHLFEPFFTTKERSKGTGLGLATVHGIVHQSGGGLTVDSAPGCGSRFTLYLPLTERPATPPPPPPPPPPPRNARANSSEVILLVEDEENIRLPAVEILESRGYRVLAAGDANEAQAVAAGHPGHIHLMVTDVVMPGLSGSQLAARLTQERPDLKVVYISGYPEDAIAHHGVLEPGRVFLQKPFSPATLLAKVREVLDGMAAAAAG